VIDALTPVQVEHLSAILTALLKQLDPDGRMLASDS